MSELGRNEDLALICEYDGCEDDCPKECSTCAIAIKTDGDVALVEKKLPSAIRFYKRALFLEPKFAEAWNNLANAYNMINEPNNALEAFEKAIAIDEEYGKALFGKAMTLRKLGRLDEAMQLANDILDLYLADEVLAFKKELVTEGVEDTQYIAENRVFITELSICYAKILIKYELYDSTQIWQNLEECGNVCLSDSFTEKVLKYCRKKYAPLGEQKIRSEYIITSFYGAMCAVLLYFQDDSIYNDCDQFEYLKDHIDIEFADRAAERMLQTKAGEEKAEHIWGVISPYVKFACDIFNKTSKLTDELILEAMKNAYNIGMITAIHYYNDRDKKHGSGTSREADNSCLESEDLQSSYQETSPQIIYIRPEVMFKGLPRDYFFSGDDKIPGAEIPLLYPLKIDVVNALKNGIPGRREWEGSRCFVIAECKDYIFYNYACYPDGSGGCNLRQSKSDPTDVVFFGASRMMGCIFHDHLIQVNNSAHATEPHLYTKEIYTAKERIYSCFGKYKTSPEDGLIYDQDIVKEMYVDKERDSLIIRVNRRYCRRTNMADATHVGDLDMQYTMTVKYIEGNFHMTAELPALNVILKFESVC